MRTVKVKFPDGDREVPAQSVQRDMTIVSFGDDRRPWFAAWEPRPMDGWRFHQTVTGEWHAFRC